MNQIAQTWINSGYLTHKEKQEIYKLNDKEKEYYFANQNLVFGTAGVRALTGIGTLKLNRFTYANLTQAYAKYLLDTYDINSYVVIGHDNRINSKKIAKYCAKILTSFKIKVLLFKHNSLMPTPIISYAIRQTAAVGGIIITASHNPKEYNGFKVYHNDGSQILPDIVNKIKSYFIEPINLVGLKFKPLNEYISFIDSDIIQKYFDDLIKTTLVDKTITSKRKNFPIVFTGHHGTSCKLLPKLVKSLKYKIKPLKSQCFYNKKFKNSPFPNPEDPKSFDEAKKYADQLKSNIIIGVDPDADRMAIMIKHNNNWTILSGNEMGTIYAYYVLKNKTFTKQPYIISSFVSTNLIDRIAKDYNCSIYRSGTGFKWMGNLMTEIGSKQDFVVAFEEAIGALNSTINRDKDAFSATILALEIYSKYIINNMDFIDILQKEIYPKYGWWLGKTVSYTIKELDWKEIIQQKMNIVKKSKIKTIGPLTISKIEWNEKGDCLDWLLENDNWIRFRMSGTEPKFKVYYNLYADNMEKLNERYDTINKEIYNLINL